MFKCVSFSLHSFCGQWEGWDPETRFNHTSLMTVITPTDRPKSDRNRYAIVFGGVVSLISFSDGIGDFVIRLG